MEPDLFPLDAEEARVLGCLIEKGMTTPDQYPMSLNGVRVACNQVSNRNPVVDYDETTVAQTLRRLADRGLAKMVHRPGDRVVKYKHAAGDVLELDDHCVSLLAVLLLRGPQTPGELRQRTTRYAEFTGLADVEIKLNDLRSAELVTELPRDPGQKENRWRSTITDAAAAEQPPTAHGEGSAEPSKAAGPVSTPAATAELEARVVELERRLQALLDALDVSDI
ncbi:MAG TPA: YceH family protein [Acidimicrobiia bacterium]|jgi:uncharacterized protein YceH (UPF0502 family)|nr:YceH family protein [Acidimicrobiia bacterium]